MAKGENGEFWVEEFKDPLLVPVKSKRKVKPKKMEFDGWGSKPLIEFLKSIGKETEKQLSTNELTSIFTEYVNKNNLLHPVKKKRVVCDERLHYLFGKKSVPRMKISHLLEEHFAENYDDSEDENSYSSEEMEENEMTASRKRKSSSLDQKVSHHLKQVPETPKSCFASIIPENIKLVYLKRSLVQELLKDPESFESKVVGSYVRIKSDPNDYSQKNSHQLLVVTGVRKTSECGDVGAEIFLQVPNLMKEIRISMLSDENFKQEECEDLHRRLLAGSVKRLTVVELQEKVQILHEDITKQWLGKELSLLQNLIDRANEKGWRRELFEYLERKQLLEKPSEQRRLLLEVPKVIAEELEPEATLQDPEDVKQDHSCSPKSIIRATSADIGFDTQGDQSLVDINFFSKDAAEDHQHTSVQQQKQPLDASSSEGIAERFTEPQVAELANTGEKGTESQVIALSNEGGGEMHQLVTTEDNSSQGIAQKSTEVIELSDDDQEAEDPGGQLQEVDNPESVIWYYMDPQGSTQGPFPMKSLKRWKDCNYFPAGFMVWKIGHGPVLLEDMISRMLPN